MKMMRDGKLVIKPGKVPEFYNCVPAHMRPSGLRPREAYEYDFVDGRHPTADEVLLVKFAAQTWVWRENRHVLSRDVVNDYCAYVLDRCDDDVVHEAVRVIQNHRILSVQAVHGDLTFENVIIKPCGTVVFIDPGDARGMVCAELDRGKLLQSYCMRWEERKWQDPRPLPTWATELDWAFLVTHWARLIRHWPSLPTRDGLASLRRIRSS
jgi:hypothetical protein